MAHSMPPEGLKVIVQYNPLKFEGSPKKDIIKIVINDLEHLRVHLPARKNIWLRGDGWVTLHWPTSRGTLGSNSLYSRWAKLSRGEESKQLLGNLLIESIVVVDGGRVIASTAHNGNRVTQQPIRTPTTIPPISSAALAVSSASNYSPPKAMGLPIPRKRRLSTPDSPTNPTRQRLDNNPTMATQTTTSISIGRYALEDHGNSAARSDSESISDMILSTIQSESTATTRHPRLHHHRSAQSFRSSSPQQTAAAANIDPPAVAGERRRCAEGEEFDCDIHYASWSSSRQSATERARLVWQDVLEIRRQQMTLRDKEEVLLDEMEKLGGNPRPPSSANSQLPTASSVTDRRLIEMEAELREERDRRIRAERALEEVERECRSPFVVPALFRAFMTISALSP